MDFPLCSTYSNALNIRRNAVTKNWIRFIKIHLPNPQQDSITLFQSHRTFVMEMEDGERLIGKIEKGYKLITKARNFQLHLKKKTLRHKHSFTIFKVLV